MERIRDKSKEIMSRRKKKKRNDMYRHGKASQKQRLWMGKTIRAYRRCISQSSTSAHEQWSFPKIVWFGLQQAARLW
jgi:hypothetical protein